MNGTLAEMSVLDVLRHGLPHMVPATDDVRRDGCTRLFLRHEAHWFRYIDPHPRGWWTYLILDVDRADASTAWLDAELLAPNLVVTNAPGTERAGRDRTGFGHLWWKLVYPVRETRHRDSKPELLLGAVRGAFVERLGADRGYHGRITKNPLSGVYVVHEPSLAPCIR